MKTKLAIVLVIVAFLLSLFFNASWISGIGQTASQIIFLWVSFALFILIGVPISFALGLAAVFTAIYIQLPVLAIFQNLSNGINSFAFVAIAFFILLGQIVNSSGMGNDLLALANLIIGRLPGGLALMNILTSMLFGGISGSAVADTASIGTVMIPMMERQGFTREFGTAITITSSLEGMIIPPSQNMIIYSLAAGGVSVGALFLAGYLPGIVMGLAQMAYVLILAPFRHFPRGERITRDRIPMVLVRSLLVLSVGIVVVGGIVFGFFTATESSSAGVAMALIIFAIFYRKNMTRTNMLEILRSSVRTTAMVLFLIANASAFGYVMAYLQIPSLLSAAITALSSDPVVILLLVNLLLLILGLVMDMAPLIIIMTPILLPLVAKAGMSPVQFGVVLLINLGIGLCTPPVGNVLFVGCAVGKTTIERTTRQLLPLYAIMLVVLMIITFVPQVSLFLPNLFHL
ncbi:TRAP transporter large permease [Salinispira pacifica]